MNAIGDISEALWSVVDGVQGRHVGQESLSGADIAGCLVLPDLLFPGLETQSMGRH